MRRSDAYFLAAVIVAAPHLSPSFALGAGVALLALSLFHTFHEARHADR